jgi:1-acyl-sn-glycerol-3-phosphate acyltransferase
MKKPRKQSGVRVPNGIVYFLAYLLVYPFLKVVFRLQADKRGFCPPKAPFVALCNHVSFMDFVIVLLSLYPRRFNAVAAYKFFCHRPLHRFLPLMGAIPKTLFEPDPCAVLDMLSVIRRGGRLLLFPEGRCSIDGSYSGILRSTGKLLKTLGVPVISCRIEGAYSCMPFWRKGFRPGRERVTIRNLFSAGDVAALTADELNARIDAALGGEEDETLGVYRQKRLAEGLHHILYHCPACGGEFCTETAGNRIRCAACGAEAELDRAGNLRSGGVLPGSVRQWFAAQIQREGEALGGGAEPLRFRVTLRTPDRPGRGLKHSGQGVLSLDRRGWQYSGGLDGAQTVLTFPLRTVPALTFDPNDNVQVYSNGQFYVFTPENPWACCKLSVLGECAHWRFAGRAQLTPSGYANLPGRVV